MMSINMNIDVLVLSAVAILRVLMVILILITSPLRNVAVFPCKLRILPQFIFNSRDPIVMGVSIEAGVLRQGTPLCVPSKAVCLLSPPPPPPTTAVTFALERTPAFVCLCV